jgi:hypothetical protein
MGIGLDTHHVFYGAVVAEIEVNKRSGLFVATRLLALSMPASWLIQLGSIKPDRRPDGAGDEPRAQGGVAL